MIQGIHQCKIFQGLFIKVLFTILTFNNILNYFSLALEIDKPQKNYIIPCNQQVKDIINNNNLFQNDIILDNFEFSSTDKCDIISEFNINIYIASEFQEIPDIDGEQDGEQQQQNFEGCQITQININTQNCPDDGELSQFQISNILISQQEQNQQSIEYDIGQVYLQSTLISIQHVDNLVIQNIIINNPQNAVYIDQTQNIIIDNITIQNYSHDYDGSLLIYNFNELTVQNSRFQKIHNQSNGGAMVINIGNQVLIDNCFFNNIESVRGGGAYIRQIERTVIQNCQVQNIIAYHGVGFCVYQHTECLLQNITFKNMTGKQVSGYTPNGSGAFYWSVDRVIVDNITGQNLSGTHGGVISADSCLETIITNLNIDNVQSYSGGGVYTKYTPKNVLENLIVTNSASAYGTGFYFFESINNKVRNVYLKDCKTKSESLILVQNYQPATDETNIMEFDDIWVENSHYIHGSIYIQEIKHCGTGTCYFRNFTIIDNYQEDFGRDGAIYVVKSHNILLEDFKLNNITSLPNVKNSGFYIDECESVEIRNSKFQDSIGGNGMGLFLNGTCPDFVLKNTIFQNNEGGSIMLLEDQQNLILQNIKFINNRNNGLSSTIQMNNNIDTKITNLQLISNIISEGASFTGHNLHTVNISQLKCIKNQALTSGCMNVDNSDQIKIKKINLWKNRSKTIGGLLLDNIEGLYVEDGEISYNSVYENIGGMQISNSQNVNLTNLKISNNQAEFSAGGIKIENCNEINIQNVQVSNNSANESGGGQFINSQNINYFDSAIQVNTAYNGGGGLSIQSCQNILLLNLIISQNTVDRPGAGLLVQFSQTLTMKQMLFQYNRSLNKQGGGIHIESTDNILFYDGELEYNQAQSGAGFSIIGCNDVSVKYIGLRNNTATLHGGGIYISESDQIYLQNLDILNNTSQTSGGGIRLSQVANLTLKYANIFNNQALEGSGGGINIDFRSENIQMENLIIINNFAQIYGGGIYTDHTEKMIFKNTKLKDNQSPEYGAGAYCTYIQDLKFINSSFLNHGQQSIVNKYGSAIYFIKNEKILIENSDFQNNRAIQDGGALYFKNNTDISIQNTKFISNQVSDAKGFQSSGGSIYIENTENLVIQNSKVFNSYSQFYGGAFYLKNIISLNLGQNSFEQCHTHYDSNYPLFWKDMNYVLSQGGAIYYEIRDISQEKENNIQFNITDTIFLQNQASSGGALFLKVKDTEKVEFKFQNVTFQEGFSDLGPAYRYIGSNKNNLSQQQPKYLQNIGKLKQSNTFTGYYYNERTLNEEYPDFTLCIPGSKLEKGGKIFCDACDISENCDGGYIPVFPNQGYWREKTSETVFAECVNDRSKCLGNDTCQDGYTGVLCENCDLNQGFAPGGGGCAKCNSDQVVYLNVIGLFIFTCVIIGNQIYGVKKRIHKKLVQQCIKKLFNIPMNQISQLSGIIKIFIMHCQITYLVATFSLEFPFEVTNFIQILGNPSKMFSVSLNCLVEANEENDNRLGYNLSFYGLLMTVLVIIFIIILELLLYFGTDYIRPQKSLISYIKCSLLCFFLTIQPGILQNSLQFMTCREVNGIYYSSADTQIKCDTDFYKKNVFPVNLVMVLLMGLCLPIFIWVLLYKGKKQGLVNRVEFQRKYGILFMEMKIENYYWEMVSMLTKVGVVIISMVYEQKVVMKGCLCCLILISYSFLCFYKWPYLTKTLNTLSLIATFTQTLTIVLIMCIYELDQEGKSTNFFVYIAVVAIILANIVYGVYTGLLVLKDFKIFIRQNFLKFFKNCNNLGDYFQNQIKQERLAKERWNKISRSINAYNKAKHNPKINIVREDFLLYLSKEFKNGKDLREKQKDYIKKVNQISNSCIQNYSQVLQEEDMQKYVIDQSTQLMNMHQKSLIQSQSQSNWSPYPQYAKPHKNSEQYDQPTQSESMTQQNYLNIRHPSLAHNIIGTAGTAGTLGTTENKPHKNSVEVFSPQIFSADKSSFFDSQSRDELVRSGDESHNLGPSLSTSKFRPGQHSVNLSSRREDCQQNIGDFNDSITFSEKNITENSDEKN